MKQMLTLLLLCFSSLTFGQSTSDTITDDALREVLLLHKELVSIPNLPVNKELMLQNINWVAEKYEDLAFTTSLLESSTLPILLAEKEYDPAYKTVLFYFHIDGQPVNPAAWDQEDPFTPVLKQRSESGKWEPIEWSRLNGAIDDEWRVFARAAADDKAPIIMLLSALCMLKEKGAAPKINIKIIFDPEEEYGSKALKSTLDKYEGQYASDYFIVMDGPAHSSNQPTVTFGCRGIATCSITTYGAKLPQHSGHFGNYVPNPVFRLASLLSSMKDENGKVLIQDYYKGIEITPEVATLLNSVPFDAADFNKGLKIRASENVGVNYQESLQYPSLNVRQIGTSWQGEGLKTVIPEYARADIDVRLVSETDGKVQLAKIKSHIEDQGYYVVDQEPSDEERFAHDKIAKFEQSRTMNAFRTSPESAFGVKVRTQLSDAFGEAPVTIRTMGGTVPIVPVINSLNIPTVIVPMVNMDNSQHSPNENIRIGNLREGIRICMSILEMEL